MARITVTPADEDEVVFAGAAEDVADASGRVSEKPGEAAAPYLGPERDSATLASQLEEASSKASVHAEGGAQPERPYETTIEDLDSTHMPLAQRIVIVAAVVCIIGALVYYFLAMR